MIEARRYLQGQVVDGRFPLIQYLGGTEHSGVFLTECADSENHRAAIKLIDAPPGNAEPQLTRWRLAARFSHPHLLRLFDAGRCTVENAGMLYVVMEYAEENLAEILTQRPLSPSETKEMLAPMLDALGYIHGKGFVHGHIQPSNILAIGDQLKLSSDRICRIGELGERRNGNARYCAPECAAGELSTAGDVWSLGVTLVECLTENLPVTEEGGRSAVSLPAELPAPFHELARHCLAKAPQRRWNVSSLKARLERNGALAEVEEVEPPVARSEAPSKQRYPLTWIGMGLALAAILLVVIPKSGSHRAPTHSAAIESAAAQTTVAPAKKQDSSKAQVKPQPARSDSEHATVRDVTEVAPAPPASRVVPAASPTSASPAAPAALHSSDLVRGGGVLNRVLPNVLRSASDTISGTVRVRVRVDVDPSGNVTGAQFDWAGPSRYFARVSMAAAREWKFRPPDINAKNVASAWIIHFDYTNSATTATAVEQHP